MPKVRLRSGMDVNLVRTGPRGHSPVILMHAIGLDLTWWELQFSRFGAEFDVVAFDMPGHGSSDAPPPQITFDFMAEILADVISHLEAGAVHLVGLSVGGMIALTFALSRPGLVRSLSLIGTLHGFPDASRTLLRERAAFASEQGMARLVGPTLERWFPPAFRARRPDVLDRATKCLLRQRPETHAAMWEMVASLDLAARLPELSCPTLVVVGTNDGNAPVAAVRDMAGMISNAQVEEIAGAGHFAPVEKPEAFNEVLAGFLARSSLPTHDGHAPRRA